MPRRALPILLTLAVVAAGTGCGTAGPRGVSPGTPASVRDEPGGVSAGPARTDVPEPARAPALTRTPAGTVLPMPGAPEGLAVDEPDGILAVGLRRPDGLALISVQTGRREAVAIPREGRRVRCGRVFDHLAIGLLASDRYVAAGVVTLGLLIVVGAVEVATASVEGRRERRQ